MNRLCVFSVVFWLVPSKQVRRKSTIFEDNADAVRCQEESFFRGARGVFRMGESSFWFVLLLIVLLWYDVLSRSKQNRNTRQKAKGGIHRLVLTVRGGGDVLGMPPGFAETYTFLVFVLSGVLCWAYSSRLFGHMLYKYEYTEVRSTTYESVNARNPPPPTNEACSKRLRGLQGEDEATHRFVSASPTLLT